MARQIKHKFLRDEQLDVDIFVLQANTRFTRDTGTKITQSCLPFKPYGDKFKAEQEARRRCILAYERNFGDIPWDCVAISSTFVTTQVLVEMAVSPT